MQKSAASSLGKTFALGLVALVASAFAGSCAALLFMLCNQWRPSSDFALRGVSEVETIILVQLAAMIVAVTAIFILPLTLLLRWRRWESGVVYPAAGLVVGAMVSAALLRDEDATATFAVAAAVSAAAWWWLFRRLRLSSSAGMTPSTAAAVGFALLGAITAVLLWRGYADDVAATEVEGSITASDMIVGGVGDGNTLWLFDVSGQLVAYDRTNWKERVVVPAGVVAVQRRGEEVWALVARPHKTGRVNPAEEAGRADLIRIFPGGGTEYQSITYEAGDSPAAFTFAGGRPIVLTPKTVLSVDNAGQWNARKLSRQPVNPLGEVTVAWLSRQPEQLLVGRNAGEWGGGLSRIDMSTGTVSGIERRDSEDLCAGPLNADCVPVTDLLRDPVQPACVLASTGLSHVGLMSGGVLRICGNAVEIIIQRRIETAAQLVRREVIGPPRFVATEPIGSLASGSRGVVWAASPFALYRIDGRNVARTTMPEFKRRGRLYIVELEGLVVVNSLKNGRNSAVSGPTPVLISTRN